MATGSPPAAAPRRAACPKARSSPAPTRPTSRRSAAPTAGETVHFYDQTGNQPTSWAWDFGDGGTITEQSPVPTFATPGPYTVTLTATNPFGSNSASSRVMVGRESGIEPGAVVQVTPADANVGQSFASAVDRLGDQVMVWKQSGSKGVTQAGDGIFGRYFDATCQAGDVFPVDTGAGAEVSEPTVTFDGSGNFAVAWESGPASDTSIYARFFTADGAPLGSDFEVAATQGGHVPGSPAVTLDGRNRVTVSYIETSASGRTVLSHSFEVSTGPGVCTADATSLCLNDARFQVRVSWRDFADNTGVGQAVALTSDTGYCWFFTSGNVELVVKVLDGTWLNGDYWVFYGALSDVEYTITVTDTETNQVKSYHNPPRQLASVGNTEAFAVP